MKSFASFQRQLNLYGFQRITSGMDKGGYFHKFFLRGNKDGICYIQRQRIKGRGPRTPDSTKLNPNFYAVEFMPPLESDTPGPEVKEEHYNSSAVVDIQKAITNTSRNSGGGGPVLSSAAVDISRPRSNQEHGCCFHQHNNNQYRLYADLEPRRLFPPETITTTRVIHEADRNQPLSWYYSPPCLPNSNELPWSTLSQEDTPVEDDLPIDTEVTPASAPARAALMSSSLNFDDNYQHYDENAAAAAVVAADSVDDYLEPLPF